MASPYEYRNVKLVRVVDGDTVELEIDVGFRFSYRDKFRLARIDAIERYEEGGAEATSYLATMLAGGISRLVSTKRDKYGRWLAELYVPVEGGEMNVSDGMRIAGYAVPYMV